MTESLPLRTAARCAGSRTEKSSLQVAADNRFELRESQDRLLSFAIRLSVMSVAGLLVLGLGAWAWSRSAIPVKHFELVVMIAGAVLVSASFVVLGWFAVSMMRRLSGTSSPVVLVTKDGFKDVRISSQLIPWRAILKLRALSLEGGIFIVVDTSFAATIPLTFAAHIQRAVNLLVGRRGLWVTTATLETPLASALFEEMGERLYRTTGHPATNETLVGWSFKLAAGMALAMLILLALISWLP